MVIVSIPVGMACVTLRCVGAGVLVVNAGFFPDRLIQGWTGNEKHDGKERASDLFHLRHKHKS